MHRSLNRKNCGIENKTVQNPLMHNPNNPNEEAAFLGQKLLFIYIS